jgi:hypothetical protein
MIAATNPFLDRGSPVMPIGTAAYEDVPLLRVENAAGRIQSIPADLSCDGLMHLCGGSAWLRAHFPNQVKWRGFGPGPKQPPFCVFRAARALREACTHVEARRAGKLGSAAA